MKILNGFWLITSLCFSTSAMATDYYVNPTGNDSWSGTLKTANANNSNGPFKSLDKAKQTIRSLKQTNTFTGKVTVNIAAGNYLLKTPLSFNLMDNGLLGKEILWQGEPGAQVTIDAGLPISCNQRAATIFWDCPLTTLPVNPSYFDTNRIRGFAPKFEFYVNNQKMELARWPDQGWAHIELPLDTNTQFSVMEQLPTLTGNVSTAQVHIFAGNDWYDQFIGVDSVNPSANALKLTSPTGYSLASGRRFYIQNLPSLLNAPGEWLYDSATRKVSFVPPAGITPTVTVLSSLTNILIADGVNYLTFKNISFQHSAGTAIAVKNSNNVVLDQLDVNSIGGKGVEIINGSNIQVRNSKIHHTGSTGVDVSGGNIPTLQPSGHLIYNNYIHHIGTTLLAYQPGISVYGVGTKITHNLLEQGAHAAITIGGNDHLIEKNEVHHFCLQASDCGTIYSGRNWSWRGNAIRNNYIHDIIGYGMTNLNVTKNQVTYAAGGARGVYLDDGVSGFEVSGNIFENAGALNIQIGGGRDHKIVNNYFNTKDYAIWIDNRWPGYSWDSMQQNLDASPYKTAIWQHKYPELAAPMHNKTWPEGNRIERNIIVTSKPDGLLLRYFVPSDFTVITDNLLWSTTGKLTVDYNVLELNNNVGGAAWSQWVAQKIEQGSIVADPCVTISNKIMTTCANSPAKDIGFIPLPTDIGLLP